jgi:hypothetical protein
VQLAPEILHALDQELGAVGARLVEAGGGFAVLLRAVPDSLDSVESTKLGCLIR